MNRILLALFVAIAMLSCQTEKPTEIIVIGTLHQPEPNFNPDMKEYYEINNA